MQTRLGTSETKRDNQLRKLGIPVVSRVVKRLKTEDLRKSGNLNKTSNLGGDIVQWPVLLAQIQLWQQQSKNMPKQISNFSCSVRFYQISQFCSKHFAQGRLSKQVFGHNWTHSSSNFNFLTFCILSKYFSNV